MVEKVDLMVYPYGIIWFGNVFYLIFCSFGPDYDSLYHVSRTHTNLCSLTYRSEGTKLMNIRK